MTEIKKLVEAFKPTHYSLFLAPDPETKLFSGNVVIKGSKPTASKEVTLHSKGLTIASASINGTTVTASEESAHGEISLVSTNTIEAGEITVTVEFSGEITDAMQGIYPSTFLHDGKTKTIITTQFESHHAREAFPCVDEPSAKAVFELTLVTPTDVEVLSNTLPKAQTTENGKLRTEFKPTPIMSTYLLAFVFGELHSEERKTKTGTLVRSFASLAQKQSHLIYSVDEAVRVLEFFEEFFGVPYPLEKCDQVALPDFDAGAMENWGLVTYREIALLADDENRSISNEQYVSLVVAHELSHQWFGNLVTMAWWDDLWLNESFASLMEHIALDAIHPEWHQWEHYTSQDVISTTSRDIHKDIQAISVEVTDPDLIETLFDPGIVYAKGGRLLKMIREYIGPEAFIAGLRLYFKEHAYSNATRNDLWAAFESASNLKVGDIMTSWLTQSGMPVVSIDQAGSQLTLEQRRFIVDGTTDETVWPIPLLSSGLPAESVLSEKKQTYTLDNADFITLNQNGSGHFLSLYKNNAHKQALEDSFKNFGVSAEFRISTINDMLVLSRAGLSPVVDSLKLVSQLAKEDRYSVWILISRAIGTAVQLTEGDESARMQLNILKRTLAGDWFNELGIEDGKTDDSNTVQLRNMIFAMMLGGDDEIALDKAKEMVANAPTLEQLPAESRSIILGSLIKHGDIDLGRKLLSMYETANAEMQLDIVSALSSAKDTAFIDEILATAFSDSTFVRAQDLLRWLAMFLRNYYSREQTWNLLVSKWDWFEAALQRSKSFDFLPVYCAGVISTQEWAERYNALFEPKMSNKLLTNNIKIGLADVQSRVVWRTENESAIKDWLANL